jgi:hypothetical protein
MDKVAYLRELQAIPSPNARRAELLAFEGKTVAAEEVLLGNRMLWAAVELNLRLFNWERALALADQSGDDRMVSAVMWHRCALHVLHVLAQSYYNMCLFFGSRDGSKCHPPSSFFATCTYCLCSENCSFQCTCSEAPSNASI